jgi:hypothetical protein
MLDAMGDQWMPPTGSFAQVIAVEQSGQERAFVALDDLERLVAQEPEHLTDALALLRQLYEGWTNRTGGVYVNKAYV